MKTMKHTDLKNQATELALREVLTETNSGTYGPAEAFLAVGVGNPAFADYYVYTRVGDGRERRVGCGEDAPGYPRRFRDALAEAQRELAQMRSAIKAEGQA